MKSNVDAVKAALKHLRKSKTITAATADFVICFPPFSRDDIGWLRSYEFWEDADLPANWRYEHVTVGYDGNYPSYMAFMDWVLEENSARRAGIRPPRFHCRNGYR